MTLRQEREPIEARKPWYINAVQLEGLQHHLDTVVKKNRLDGILTTAGLEREKPGSEMRTEKNEELKKRRAIVQTLDMFVDTLSNARSHLWLTGVVDEDKPEKPLTSVVFSDANRSATYTMDLAEFDEIFFPEDPSIPFFHKDIYTNRLRNGDSIPLMH